MYMSTTLADKIIAYNASLDFKGTLPSGFFVKNPYKENQEVLDLVRKFYQKYYADSTKRNFIIGINPGRHGAGVTGIPFTDTQRLNTYCGIQMESAQSHEVSSVYVYDMISAYGGVDFFYKHFYINSPFPLVILRKTEKGNYVNANYYDSKELFETLKPYMEKNLKLQIELGLITNRVFVWGKKNATFIKKMNQETHLFDSIEILEHPRYIQQYKTKERDTYIQKYISSFQKNRSI